MTAIGTERRMLDADLWLYRLLRWFLLVAWWVVLAGLTLTVAGWNDPPVNSLGELPWRALPWALVPIVLTTVPVARWIERSAHQLVYGRHDDAYEIVKRVDTQLRAEQAPDALLPALAATLCRALDLPYVAIELDGGDRALTASVGIPPAGAQVVGVPLGSGAAHVGTLHASARRPNERLSAQDMALLGDLARHVGAALDVVRLNAALQRSREELVLAREEERLRIRRDLHDSLGPTLAALRLQVAVLRRTVGTEPDAAQRTIAELSDGLGAATGEIRRLVYELRPPLLDEFGLVGALRNLGAAADGIERRIEHPDPLPALPAAVEVAVYRIAAEALHNVARHAGAASCTVRLEAAAGTVLLTVTDDGRGLPQQYLAGVGHRSMRERAEELGGSVAIGPAPAGGVEVAARFPLQDGA